jgi:hypothetical protein
VSPLSASVMAILVSSSRQAGRPHLASTSMLSAGCRGRQPVRLPTRHQNPDYTVQRMAGMFGCRRSHVCRCHFPRTLETHAQALAAFPMPPSAHSAGPGAQKTGHARTRDAGSRSRRLDFPYRCSGTLVGTPFAILFSLGETFPGSEAWASQPMTDDSNPREKDGIMGKRFGLLTVLFTRETFQVKINKSRCPGGMSHSG